MAGLALAALLLGAPDVALAASPTPAATVKPTASPTPVPPTPTRVPPTATPLPPSATPTPPPPRATPTTVPTSPPSVVPPSVVATTAPPPVTATQAPSAPLATQAASALPTPPTPGAAPAAQGVTPAASALPLVPQGTPSPVGSPLATVAASATASSVATSPTPNPLSSVVTIASPSPVGSPVGATVTAVPTSSITPTPDAAQVGIGSIHGVTFLDDNADGQLTDAKQRLTNVELVLTFASGLLRTTHSDAAGQFRFDGLPPGTYHVTLSLPDDYVATTDAGEDVEVVDGADTSDLQFGLITREAAGLAPDGSAPDAASDDEQIIALASVTSLPLRFAEGRDVMNQVQRRVLGDGLIWLGVPFRSQLDGGNFQYVNCGPASLTMVLAGFGLEVGPSQVRDYLNSLIDNYDTDLGTSLDTLSRIATQAGLTPMDLYSAQGGYRNWSTDAVRWHVQQGHPVITLVKYRNLPGHTSSLSDFDHYIVITGLTPNGFIYNDGAFATTLGYGLEISDVELEYAWDNSSIPHHALALGLSPDQKSLTFPELPRQSRSPSADVVARSTRRLADADAGAVSRAPLVLTPVAPATPAPTAASAPTSLIGDGWEEDPSMNVSPLDAARDADGAQHGAERTAGARGEAWAWGGGAQVARAARSGLGALGRADAERHERAQAERGSMAAAEVAALAAALAGDVGGDG